MLAVVNSNHSKKGILGINQALYAMGNYNACMLNSIRFLVYEVKMACRILIMTKDELQNKNNRTWSSYKLLNSYKRSVHQNNLLQGSCISSGIVVIVVEKQYLRPMQNTIP
jgi:hypothetical protein